ncbi:MAG TPA: glutamate--tRNA ligase, partial [Caulobacteraceae bacterium]
ALPYAEAKARLAAADCDLGEEFWTVARPNLARFSDVAEIARMVRGPVTPFIEDPAFMASAAGFLPDVIDETAWKRWTDAVKEATGAKGRALFMPLRQALTGSDHGPDMATLAPLIGRERIARRLAGETA